ncbi:Phosphoribosylanthranilate isomerase [hydrothermal vent metagenome]|uniref:phosphoribosylanthranilate isomerase n=1 Tax=hydrothermal vent metagenome TaxID=652676 RepID=A0A3B0WSF8_9ZZZZ
MRTRVKICGITRIEDAQLTVDAGADAIGLVFYENSPRFVSHSQAQAISQTMPAFVTRVALFKDADKQTIQSTLDNVEIDLIQFHGSESVEFCEQFTLPYIKAIGMKAAQCDADYLIASAKTYSTAKALLLDGHAPGEAGGTGETFDWSSIAAINKPIVLAGGLTAENVKQAIDTVHPFAVDVSSGVESAPGIKDKNSIAEFMKQVSLSGK